MRQCGGLAKHTHTQMASRQRSASSRRYDALSRLQQEQVEYVKSVIQDWTEDEVIDFCEKHGFEAVSVQNGVNEVLEGAPPPRAAPLWYAALTALGQIGDRALSPTTGPRSPSRRARSA